MLLQLVQEVFGRNEVVQEVAETVVLIRGLQDGEDLDKETTRYTEDQCTGQTSTNVTYRRRRGN